MTDIAALSDVEFDRHVQEKALAHLEACLEAEDDWEAVSPAYAPFDGCYTCIVREVLMVAWDEMWARAQADARRALDTS
jgi:hypothetical protein